LVYSIGAACVVMALKEEERFDRYVKKYKRDKISYAVKLCLVGYLEVGKTSLIGAMLKIDDSLPMEATRATIQSAIHSKTVTDALGDDCKLEIWDTAGQERYAALFDAYLRNCNAALLVYDVTKRESLDALTTRWWPDLQKNEIATVIVVGNKCDLLPRDIPRAENSLVKSALSFCKRNNLLHVFTTCTEPASVRLAFQECITQYAKLTRHEAIEYANDWMTSEAARQAKRSPRVNLNHAPTDPPPSDQGTCGCVI
jgi:small GTP-binding protein